MSTKSHCVLTISNDEGNSMEILCSPQGMANGLALPRTKEFRN